MQILIGALIDPIEKKSAFDRSIKIFRLDEADFLSDSNLKPDCHILYVSGANSQKVVFKKIQANPHKAGTLVVGESETFAAEGGMIGFVNRNGKIKLQINQQSVKQTGLKISAKLFEIAELTKEEGYVTVKYSKFPRATRGSKSNGTNSDASVQKIHL